MQSYNKIVRLLTGLCLIGGLLWACSDEFLEVSPKGSLAPEVLATKAGIEGVVLGAYAQLGGRGNYFGGASNWATGSIQGGEANKGTEDGDFGDLNEVVRYQLAPTSRVPRDKWVGLFEGVTRTNAALDLIAIAVENDLLQDDDIQRLTAEARFLRGHYYFQLQIAFSKAPFIPAGLTLEEQQQVVATSNWANIEEDFRFAYENLPETLPQAGRANKWAAGAYLGKTYLYQEKWQDARDLLNKVVEEGKTTNGQKYALLENYSDAFNAVYDNSSESVFAIQAAANSGTTNVANPDFVLNFPYNSGPVGCCGFYAPSFDYVNSFRTDDGLPLPNHSYNNPSNQIKSDLGVESNAAFTPDQGPVDPRLDHVVGRRGIPYLGFGDNPGKAWIRKQDYAGPYLAKKFGFYADQVGTLTDGSSWTAGYTAVNYNIIRFADVLLLLAEAEAELGNTSRALELVNRVRARAANSSDFVKRDDGTNAANYQIQLYNSFGSKQEALNAIYFERKLELGLEGHRFFDLRRWGIVESEIERIIDFERNFVPAAYAGADFETPQDLYYPIPQDQIDIQGTEVLPQNEGY